MFFPQLILSTSASIVHHFMIAWYRQAVWCKSSTYMTHIIINENIVELILYYLKSARRKIRLSLHHLTDRSILHELVEQSKRDVQVELILNNVASNWLNACYFNQLIASGSRVYMVHRGNDQPDHDSNYCLIDGRVWLSGTYSWSLPLNDKESLLVKKVMNDKDQSEMLLQEKHFTDSFFRYGIIYGDCGSEHALSEYPGFVEKEDRAGFYYDSAVAYLKINKLSEALVSINDGIRLHAADDPLFYLLKHQILLESKLLVASSESFYQYFRYVDKTSKTAVSLLKITYRNYKRKVRENGAYACGVITHLNQQTCENLDLFDAVKIRPHFFKMEELRFY